MHPILIQANRKAIESVYEDIFKENIRTHISFVVTDMEGTIDDSIIFPEGSSYPIQNLPNGKSIQAVTINISASACSNFYYDESSNSFFYECTVKGKPFTGNIPILNVIKIFEAPISQNQEGAIFYLASLIQPRNPQINKTNEQVEPEKKGGHLKLVK